VSVVRPFVIRDRRVYVAGRRVHHGLAGLVAILVGMAAVVHDWRDRPWWLRDRP
jgi:hypothetical protein